MKAISSVDYLFKGSHPAFFWAAALLARNGKKVVIQKNPELSGWECFPADILDSMGLNHQKVDRNIQPLQVLTPRNRFAIYSDGNLTRKDHEVCTGGHDDPELRRGLQYFSRGFDYPHVTQKDFSESIDSFLAMEFVDSPPEKVKQEWCEALERFGVRMVELQEQDLPQADQIIEFDFSHTQVFRTKKEITIPLNVLPPGASPRMIYVESHAPMIEMIHWKNRMVFRGFFNEFPGWIDRLLKQVEPYFPGSVLDPSQALLSAPAIAHQEWVDLHRKGLRRSFNRWMLSPMNLPEWGEKTTYLRLSQILRQNHKKEQLFVNKELFNI